jgi:hypothetical protein
MTGTRVLSCHNFVVTVRGWPHHGLTLGELLARDPDAVLALAAYANRDVCPVLLLRAIRTAATLRRLDAGARRPSVRRRPRAAERFVTA